MSGENKYPYSVHSFMLPMRWDYLPKDFCGNKETIDFDRRTDMRVFAKMLDGTKWERKFYRIAGNPVNYNELTYFHAYAARTIFDLQQADELTVHDFSQNKTMAYFEIPFTEGDYYEIKTRDNLFKLSLTGISLHVYNTGIAILSYNLENFSYSDKTDILKINEFGRRIYPQFLGNDIPFTNSTKFAFLASELKLKCEVIDYGFPIIDNFEQYDELATQETHSINNRGNYEYHKIIEIPDIIQKLFNEKFVFCAKDEVGGDVIRFNILTDDRMFFQSWCGNNDLANQFKQLDKIEDGKSPNYATNDFWYAYIFGDRAEDNLGLKNKVMQAKHTLDTTYDRWLGYGTLFGFTRDSFVAVSEDVQTLKNNFAPDVRVHFKTMYYQIAILCLAQRASVLRFSAEVSALADLGRTEQSEISKRIQQLYLNYIEFINKIYFREITPQIQGIEIYRQFQKVMNIPDDIKDLDGEIGELHQYVALLQDERRNEDAARLNKLAIFFLPFSIVFGVLGMNALSENNLRFSANFDGQAIAWICIGICISLIMSWILSLIISKNKN